VKLELRPRLLEDHVTTVMGAVLISESEAESQILDQLFGNKVGEDGLIARRQVEVRLSDGYAEHYLYVVPVGQEKPA
jgi:gamma-glutamylcyclotransferase (GGCT)/AIG2-like uncharacterized protein YtfP